MTMEGPARSSSTQTSSVQATTLADAFSHISSSLTSSIASANMRAPVEKTVCYESADAWRLGDAGESSSYIGHKLVLKEAGSHAWEPLDSSVVLRKRPFAHGGQRNAFHLFHGTEHFVAKESRFNILE